MACYSKFDYFFFFLLIIRMALPMILRRAEMSQGKLCKELLENEEQLFAFISTLTLDDDAVRDIYQETALAIVGEDDRGTSVRNFAAWSREIARRRFKEYYRKARRRRTVKPLSDEIMEMTAKAYHESEAAIENQRARAQFLHECLVKLTGRSRELIRQRTLTHIARIL